MLQNREYSIPILLLQTNLIARFNHYPLRGEEEITRVIHFSDQSPGCSWSATSAGLSRCSLRKVSMEIGQDFYEEKFRADRRGAGKLPRSTGDQFTLVYRKEGKVVVETNPGIDSVEGGSTRVYIWSVK